MLEQPKGERITTAARHMMNLECFALLDDASAAGSPRSRLYTGHAGTLACHDSAGWPRLLERMQQALRRGQHAVCLCTYELGRHLQGLPARSDGCEALARILLFERCEHLSPEEVADWLAERTAPDDTPAGVAAVRASVDQAGFTAALERIHAWIEAGDTYQVNYTYRVHFDAFGSLHALYARLRERQPVPYGALIVLADASAVLSLSPELFVRHARGKLTARPMKGTAPAAPPDQGHENALRAAALAADPKNRAENLMIVDLLRNDMGRIAVTGSVAVPALFEVQRYGGVLQMTSSVQADLRADATLADIFTALYPCGSITGAPKRRTMEIIDALEPDPRGIYTGAIGWFEPPSGSADIGDFCLSVPIRTLALQAQEHGVRRGRMGVGAGIVHDSEAGAEFAECRLKAGFLTGLGHAFELFETMHASRENGVRYLERHLRRLSASALYFGFVYQAEQVRLVLAQACAGFAEAAPRRLRLALSQAGACSVHSAPLTPLLQPARVLLGGAAMHSEQLFLRHKTSLRERYDQAWRDAEARGAFDTLFVNQRGELTEGGRSNVFVKLDGRWYTPPLASGVLPGIMRGVLLDDPAWNASERVLTPAQLDLAQEIVVCNALRGILPATLVRC